MKTIEQFLSEVKADKELEQKLIAVKDDGELAEFLKANDVEGTIEEFRDLVEKERAIGELSEEELEAVAGGQDGMCSILNHADTETRVIRRDSQGRAIEWVNINACYITQYHYECSECQTWMYKNGHGTVICDKCGEWSYFNPNKYRVVSEEKRRR